MLRVSPTQTQTTLILHSSHKRSGGTHILLGIEAQPFPLPSTLSPTLPYELFHLATRELLPVVVGVSDPPLLVVVVIYKRIFVGSVTNFVIGDEWFCSVFKLKMGDSSKMCEPSSS